MARVKNSFEILGLEPRFAVKPEELERLQREHFAAQSSGKRVTLEAVNEAYRRLKDPVARAELLFTLRKWPPKAPLDPALLESVFTERETIDAARKRCDSAFLSDWVSAARKRQDALVAELGVILDETVTSDHPPVKALELLDQLRYLTKALHAAQSALDAVEALEGG